MNKLQWVFDLISETVGPNFCGSIEINAQFGGITVVNVKRGYKPPKTTQDVQDGIAMDIILSK